MINIIKHKHNITNIMTLSLIKSMLSCTQLKKVSTINKPGAMLLMYLLSRRVYQLY